MCCGCFDAGIVFWTDVEVRGHEVFTDEKRQLWMALQEVLVPVSGIGDAEQLDLFPILHEGALIDFDEDAVNEGQFFSFGGSVEQVDGPKGGVGEKLELPGVDDLADETPGGKNEALRGQPVGAFLSLQLKKSPHQSFLNKVKCGVAVLLVADDRTLAVYLQRTQRNEEFYCLWCSAVEGL